MMKRLVITSLFTTSMFITGCNQSLESETPNVNCKAGSSIGIECYANVKKSFEAIAKVSRVALLDARGGPNDEIISRGFENASHVILYLGQNRDPTSKDYDMRLTWQTNEGWNRVDTALNAADDSFKTMDIVDIVGYDMIKMGDWLESFCLSDTRSSEVIKFCSQVL